jgi:molybdopterin/thiamine biosynthesis adenylyltransferase
MAEQDKKDIERRYSRQTLFSPIGENGQRLLLQSRVAIVGLGALGSVLANHLVRAGVGFTRLIDRDFVDETNLQRQMLYEEKDATEGTPKAAAAADRLRQANSGVTIEPVVSDLNASNAEDLLSDVDLILDGSDNFAVRFLINDVSVKFSIPWIYGGAVSSRGVALTILPGETPCLRCMFGAPPAPGTTETCDTAGVIGPVVHTVASFQAAEALKILVHDRTRLNLKMLETDMWFNRHHALDVSGAKKADCPCCAERRYQYLDSGFAGETEQSLCGRDTVQILPKIKLNLDLAQWEQKWSRLGPVQRNPFLLRFNPEPHTTLVLFPDGRALIQGVQDPVIARNLYSRYVGM